MLPILLGALVLGGIALAVSTAKAKKKPAPTSFPPPVAKLPISHNIALGFYLMAVKAYKAGDKKEGDYNKERAARAFDSLGLAKSAIAVRRSEPLPSDELWPGSHLSVRDFIAYYRKQKVSKRLALKSHRGTNELSRWNRCNGFYVWCW